MGWSQSKPEHPADKVILYQFGRAPHLPSPSPFCLKLETYLRLAKIDYQNEFDTQMSSKGKCPWIMYKGKAVADSQFCIQFLNKEFNVDLNKNLTAEQCATSRAFLELVEDHLLWFFALNRWYYGDRSFARNNVFPQYSWLMKFFLPIYIGRKVCNAAWDIGIGRHTYDEQVDIMQRDMKALSDYLGDKDYFMGSEPTEIDCALFGNLANLKWCCAEESPQRIYMLEHCENLNKYCDRMKERVWPDWDENITSPPSKEKSKDD